MNLYKIYIDPTADLEMIWELLEERGCTPLYSETTDDVQSLLVSLPPHTNVSLLQHSEILKIEEAELPAIDWENQWSMHPDYRDGLIHVDLQKYTPYLASPPEPSSLKLGSGPGFGDFSHPTTRLVLDLMPSYIQHQHVVDVGCGSGILSFAAVAMGARSVCGIDIDSDALVHAQANSSINNMEDQIEFLHPESCQHVFPDSVILMNMIQSEQEIALASLNATIPRISFAVTSGILLEGRTSYLQLCDKWGWKLINEKEEDGWLGFVFKAWL